MRDAISERFVFEGENRRLFPSGIDDNRSPVDVEALNALLHRLYTANCSFNRPQIRKALHDLADMVDKNTVPLMEEFIQLGIPEILLEHGFSKETDPDDDLKIDALEVIYKLTKRTRSDFLLPFLEKMIYNRILQTIKQKKGVTSKLYIFAILVNLQQIRFGVTHPFDIIPPTLVTDVITQCPSTRVMKLAMSYLVYASSYVLKKHLKDLKAALGVLLSFDEPEIEEYVLLIAATASISTESVTKLLKITKLRILIEDSLCSADTAKIELGLNIVIAMIPHFRGDNFPIALYPIINHLESEDKGIVSLSCQALLIAAKFRKAGDLATPLIISYLVVLSNNQDVSYDLKISASSCAAHLLTFLPDFACKELVDAGILSFMFKMFDQEDEESCSAAVYALHNLLTRGVIQNGMFSMEDVGRIFEAVEILDDPIMAPLAARLLEDLTNF